MLKKMVRFWLILGLAAALFWQMPVMDVHAEMEISTDTTWSGTVDLDQDVRVTSGARLTIEPGTTVRMANSDAGNVGVDPNRIEIIIDDGEIMADGATFTTLSGSWYGIVIKTGGSGEITNATLDSAIVAINVGNTSSTVLISGNEIYDLQGNDGTNSSRRGQTVYGILVDNSGDLTIEDNIIHDITAGSGYDGLVTEGAGAGGNAYGIFVEAGAPLIKGNHIYNITGGDGGDGGIGVTGADGADGILVSRDGEDGSVGGVGETGGDGGDAWGIYITSSIDGVMLNNNVIDHISGGMAGDGGAGGAGGAGGQGYVGSSGEAGTGGSGGNGGMAGTGGTGGNGGDAYGIQSAGVNLLVYRNTITYVSGGMAGRGGDGGTGGAGGAGGDGGNASSFGGGDGGPGGDGGTAGFGGNAGLAGDAYGFFNSAGGHFDNFSGNQIRLIYGGSATIGGTGGTGGAGGVGGDGGAGWDTYPGGWGGLGGDGGDGRLAGDGASSGKAYALQVYLTGVNSGNITSSIFAQVTANRGGMGGTGGAGGAGGDGGTGGPGGTNGGSAGGDGSGGAGGNGGDGGDGGVSNNAYLVNLDTTVAVVTNNTLFTPSANAFGGTAGTAGLAGLGGSGATPGSDGAAGSTGSQGTGGASYGVYTLSGTFNVYNTILMAVDAVNSTGLYQGAGATVFGDYNNLWHWGTDYVDNVGVHDLAADPLLEDPFNGGYELLSGSPCIDVGDNGASGLPTSDYKGWSRIHDGDGNGSAVVDMGAYEFYYVNAAPSFTSTPVTDAIKDTSYTYAVAADDANLPDGDELEITADVKPDWLTLDDHGDGTASLSGTPASGDVGDNSVTLRVTDRDGVYALQTFTITVAEGYPFYLPLLVR